VRNVGNTGRQLRSKDDSNNAFRTADFDEYGAVISNVFEMSWNQITTTKYGFTKQAMR